MSRQGTTLDAQLSIKMIGRLAEIDSGRVRSSIVWSPDYRTYCNV